MHAPPYTQMSRDTPLRPLPPHQVAETIKGDAVNVLIDLTGYTMSMQTEVMAIGPAPVQVPSPPPASTTSNISSFREGLAATICPLCEMLSRRPPFAGVFPRLPRHDGC